MQNDFPLLSLQSGDRIELKLQAYSLTKKGGVVVKLRTDCWELVKIGRRGGTHAVEQWKQGGIKNVSRVCLSDAYSRLNNVFMALKASGEC